MGNDEQPKETEQDASDPCVAADPSNDPGPLQDLQQQKPTAEVERSLRIACPRRRSLVMGRCPTTARPRARPFPRRAPSTRILGVTPRPRYYAMEYIDGATLAEVVDCSGPMPSGRVIHVLRSVAAALVEAHGIGLIHRDIKPANVLLFLPHEFGGVAEGVKLVDFGLVKELDSGGGIQLTNANAISGTPQYMSPEAIRDSRHVDGRADLYAVGAVGYYLLTGQHVFEGSTVVEVCSHHLHTPPVPPSQRVTHPIPTELEALILRCLAKDPASRPPTARDLEKSLEALALADPWPPEAAHAWWMARRAERNAATVPPSGGSAELALTIEVRRAPEPAA